jgi:hypothetical protein
MAAVAGQERETAPAVSGQESTEVKNMSLYVSQRCWGRSCMHLTAAMRAGHWHWHFAGHRAGDSFHEATDPQGHGQRLIIKKPASRQWLKTERKMMKLKVQFDWEIRFGQSIRCRTRTPGAVAARYADIVAHSGHRRTAEADQARIDLWIFLGDSSP